MVKKEAEVGWNRNWIKPAEKEDFHGYCEFVIISKWQSRQKVQKWRNEEKGRLVGQPVIAVLYKS